MSDGSVLTFKTRAVSQVRKGPLQPYTNWDREKVYRLPVVLMSFADCDFSCENPQQFYDRMFNEPGYNEGVGVGCVADYFRDQSGGLFNVRFDVVGPIKLTSNQKNNSSYNSGMSQIRETIMTADEQLNYADYDWDGDGKAETVIIVYAGYGGNETAAVAKGCIWPSTDNLYFSLDGVRIGGYSASPELWTNDTSCGIGTVCHEFCHVLGLPDLYPTSGNEFSVLDEWDLMDGGNYAGDGWCPPNLSIHEREYLGWQIPEELTVSTTITDMPSYDRNGTAYRIVNDAYPSEYYLLENRQQVGWDLMLPGHGLLITHVDFVDNLWMSNNVNGTPSHHRLDYFHADGLDFNYYDELYARNSVYGEDGRNLRLKNTAYPYTDSLGVVHDALTDTSTPAATLFNARSDGSLLMGKSVTDIREINGLISFRFEVVPAGISDVLRDVYPVAAYDLQGRQTDMDAMKPATIYIIRYSDGSVKKIIR